MKFCRKCGAQLEDGANFCPKCGAPVAEESGVSEKQMNNGGNSQVRQNPNTQQQPQNNNGTPGDEPGKSEAIASMVIGIIACVLVCFDSTIGLGIVGMIAGIVAIVLSSVSKKKGCTNGMRTAGLVLGIIAVVLNAIFLVACATCLAGLGYWANNL